MTGAVVGSVLIPAHDEAAVIGRCLDHLLAGIAPGSLDVVVAANGCTDDTAAIARRYPVRVIEVAEAGKPGAIRAGEAELGSTFPRLYLDADVILDGPMARRVLVRLAEPGALAARPPFRYATDHSSALVRRYYRARSALPAVMGSIWGAGVYGLSATGRARFGPYPDVVAEDLFVDRHFGPAEIDIVGDDAVIVTAPARYPDLLKVMRRSYRGAAEDVPEAEPSSSPTGAGGADRPTTGSTVNDVLRLARGGPSALIDALTYGFVAVTARLYIKVGRSTRWERDDSSRTVEPV